MSVSTRRHRTGLGLALGVAVVACVVAAAPPDARAAEEHTWHSLTTGNGHGFQVFDESTHRITTFLEHPQRYVSARPGAPTPAESQGDGVERTHGRLDVRECVQGADFRCILRVRARLLLADLTGVGHLSVGHADRAGAKKQIAGPHRRHIAAGGGGRIWQGQTEGGECGFRIHRSSTLRQSSPDAKRIFGAELPRAAQTMDSRR